MLDIKDSQLIRLYRISIPRPGHKGRPRLFSRAHAKYRYCDYFDYFVDDLVDSIKAAGLEKEVIKKLK